MRKVMLAVWYMSARKLFLADNNSKTRIFRSFEAAKEHCHFGSAVEGGLGRVWRGQEYWELVVDGINLRRWVAR